MLSVGRSRAGVRDRREGLGLRCWVRSSMSGAGVGWVGDTGIRCWISRVLCGVQMGRDGIRRTTCAPSSICRLHVGGVYLFHVLRVVASLVICHANIFMKRKNFRPMQWYLSSCSDAYTCWFVSWRLQVERGGLRRCHVPYLTRNT